MQLFFGCNRTNTVTKRQKLLLKLFKEPPPRDLTWEELESTLLVLGFEFVQNPGGSSHGKFKHKDNPSLRFSAARPHPKPTVGVKTIKSIVQWLREHKLESRD